MTASLCVACHVHPQHWRSFCALCSQWLGVMWRRRITEGGTSERRRAISAIQTHLSSLNRVKEKWG